LLAIQSLGTKSDSCIKVHLDIQGVEMAMKLDTGASVSIISDSVQRKVSNVVLEKSDTKLRAYTGEPIKVLQLKSSTGVKNVIYLRLW